MSKKNTTAQPTYQLLVANLRGSSDPAKGINPTKVRSEFVYQHFPEVPAQTADTGPDTQYEKTPGLRTRVGLLDWTTPGVPVTAGGLLTIANTDFSAQATLYLGGFTLVSGEAYNVTAGTTYTNEDITNTAPDNIKTLFDTAGPNFINVPANLPIAPGTVTISWTSGGNPYSQTDDGAGGFTGDGTPAGSAINYTTGAITLDTAALPPDAATSILITYTAVITAAEIATNLANAISVLPGYTAIPGGAAVNIQGPAGPDGNDLRFEAVYEGAVANFTLVPADGSLTGGEPTIGPPDIS